MLSFRNVTIKKDKQLILDDFSLEIPTGAMLALVGPDRQARSMILEAASGHVVPDSGDVLLDGLSIFMNREDCFLRMGYMPGVRGFPRQLRTAEYYEMILSLYRIRGRNQRVRIGEVLDFLGLSACRDSFIEDLAPETRHMLWLGSAILHEPEWLFLENPFQSLEQSSREKVIHILLSLHERGTSIVINSMPVPDLMAMITDVAAIREGKVYISGPLGEVYEEILRQSPVKMKVLSNMDQALAVLKENALVERVTVKDNEVIFRFTGEETEEARLLSSLVDSGALVQNYTRDRLSMNEMFGM